MTSNSFSQRLRQEREVIIKTWMEAVLQNSEITSSRGCSTTQFRDHVPDLLEDLADRLGHHASASGETSADASAHGYFRWKQGYDLSELLKELSLLRTVLTDHLARPFAGSSEPEARLATVQAVHRFLDEVVQVSTVRFAEHQQAALKNLSTSRLGLLRTVSHELRNAVNAIHLVLEFQGDCDGPEERERSHWTLRRTVSHLRSLLDNLLDFAQISEETVRLERAIIDPRDLAEELERTYRNSFEEAKLSFCVEVDPTLEKFESDPVKLRQISSNLLSNALKYTQQGQVTLRLYSAGATRWALQVTDTGPGISGEAQARLCEEFYRAPGTEHIHGTGLGLAITKRLVEMMQGTLRIESLLGHGSTFEAILPKQY